MTSRIEPSMAASNREIPKVVQSRSKHVPMERLTIKPVPADLLQTQGVEALLELVLLDRVFDGESSKPAV